MNGRRSDHNGPARSARGRDRARIAACCSAAVMLGGCGAAAQARRTTTTHTSSAPPPQHAAAAAPPVCTVKARDALAHFLTVSPGSIATDTSTGNNSMPQCSLTARATGGRRVQVLANVDDSPSPYFRLERTIVEASEGSFGAKRLSPPPVAVPRFGLEASWFPAAQWLMATDGTRLITASVDWSGATQARKIELTKAVASTYLKTPHGKAAQALAEGYPSG